MEKTKIVKVALIIVALIVIAGMVGVVSAAMQKHALTPNAQLVYDQALKIEAAARKERCLAENVLIDAKISDHGNKLLILPADKVADLALKQGKKCEGF